MLFMVGGTATEMVVPWLVMPRLQGTAATGPPGGSLWPQISPPFTPRRQHTRHGAGSRDKGP
jgi:hypothetical protein